MHTWLHNAGRRRTGVSRPGAFTLIEILIVIVILGILATIVVPQFSNASTTARENALRDELRYLRTQIIVYKAQHRDVAPGADGTAATFLDQMTKHSDEEGNTSSAASAIFKYGPYLSRFPTNSLNNLDTVEISNANPLAGTGDGSHGWVYNPATQELIADLSGSDTSGTRYDSY